MEDPVMQDVIHDPVRDWCACEPEGDVRCGYRILADAVIAKLAPRDGDEAEVALLITAVYQAADRVAGLEALARDMLSRFVRTSDGHRARAGQVQIARWEKQLGGGNGVSRTPGARCRGGPSPRRRAAAGSPPWPGPATGARSGRTSTGAPTSGRRRALNAALEAEEIMPDTKPWPDWYHELREDD